MGRTDQTSNIVCYCESILLVTKVVTIINLQLLNSSGDQDQCYYNFNCAHPVGFLRYAKERRGKKEGFDGFLVSHLPVPSITCGATLAM